MDMATNPNCCNTCGCNFDTDANCYRAALKNRRFAATLDSSSNIIQECCDHCQQDIYDSLEVK